MINKKLVTTVVAAALVAVVGIGSTLAYLQDETEGTTNTFTIGDVKIDLDEPTWNPENGNDMLPGATVAKNPIVTNVGQTEAFIGVRIDGMKEVTDRGFIVKSDKNDVVLDAVYENKELTDSSKIFAWNPSYTLVDKTGAVVTAGEDTVLTVAELTELVNINGDVLFFAYNSPIVAGAQTQSLFDTVKLDTDVPGASSAYTIVKHFVDENGTILVEDEETGLIKGIPAKDGDQYKYKFTIKEATDNKVYDTYDDAKKAIDAMEAKDTTATYEFNMIVKAAAIQSTNQSDNSWAEVTHWYPELPASFLKINAPQGDLD